MFTSQRNVTRRIVIITAALGAFGVSNAAPPGKGEPPPAVDVSYMSVSYKDTFGNPTKAAVRGMAITSNGTFAGDAELWRSATRTSSSISLDPTGTWLAWFQESSSRGTPAITIATPGKAPVNVYVFSLEFLWTYNRPDAIAWGRGCAGNPVLIFLANKGPALAPPSLWVLDPFATGSQPQELYSLLGSVPGLAMSPLGKLVALGEYSASGEAGIVVLPLTCAPGNSLPVVAGPAQPLFATRYEADEGWTTSLDWSNDGQRLALAMGRRVPRPGGALLYDPEVWVAELNYLEANGSEQVSFASLQHVASGAASFPSWAPTAETANCDRMAYARNGGITLHDVPRLGFSTIDCDIQSPTALGGKSVAALDWK